MNAKVINRWINLFWIKFRLYYIHLFKHFYVFRLKLYIWLFIFVQCLERKGKNETDKPIVSIKDGKVRCCSYTDASFHPHYQQIGTIDESTFAKRDGHFISFLKRFILMLLLFHVRLFYLISFSKSSSMT